MLKKILSLIIGCSLITSTVLPVGSEIKLGNVVTQKVANTLAKQILRVSKNGLSVVCGLCAVACLLMHRLELFCTYDPKAIYAREHVWESKYHHQYITIKEDGSWVEPPELTEEQRLENEKLGPRPVKEMSYRYLWFSGIFALSCVGLAMLNIK